MANELIRPVDLPVRNDPVASEVVPSDNGTAVGGLTLEKLVNAGRPLASKAEAEAGTSPSKAMTPLTTKQAVTARIGVDIASKAQGDKADTALQAIVAGPNTTVDTSDPLRPIVSSSGDPSAGDKLDVEVVAPGQWVIARDFETVTDLLSDTERLGYAGSGARVTVSLGQVVTAQGFRYEVAASDATDEHVETAGGVKLYLVSRLSARAFGDGNTSPADAHALQTTALSTVEYSGKTYTVTAPVVPDSAAYSSRLSAKGEPFSTIIATDQDIDLYTRRNRSRIVDISMEQSTSGTGRAVTTSTNAQSAFGVLEDSTIHGFRYGVWNRYSLWDTYENMGFYDNTCGIRLARTDYQTTNADPVGGSWNLLIPTAFFNNCVKVDTVLFEGGEVGFWGTVMGTTLLNVTTQNQLTDGTANDVLPDGQKGTGIVLDWDGSGGRGWQNIVVNHYVENTKIGAIYKDQRYVGVHGMFMQGGPSANRAEAAIIADNSTVEVWGLTGQDYFDKLVEAKNGATVYLNSESGSTITTQKYVADATSRIKMRGMVDRDKYEYRLNKPAGPALSYTLPNVVPVYGVAELWFTGLRNGTAVKPARAQIIRWNNAIPADVQWIGTEPTEILITMSGGIITVTLDTTVSLTMYPVLHIIGGADTSGTAMVIDPS